MWADFLARCIRWLLWRVPVTHYFSYWQAAGFHVLPVNFYSPVPDTRALDPVALDSPSAMLGIDLDEERQRLLVESFAADYADEYDALPVDAPGDSAGFFYNNGFFESVDPELLYCMIRRYRPGRIVEVGSGFSTRIASLAVAANRAADAEYTCDYTLIDPYVNDAIKRDVAGHGRILEQPVQTVALSVFESLGVDDILFVDLTA